MNDTVIKNIKELNDKRSKHEILSECINELHDEGKRWWVIGILIVISFIFGVGIILFANAVSIIQVISALFLDVELAFFAVIFGAYAVFQALMRDEIIRELIKTDNNILKQSNSSFLNLSLLYIFNIFISIIVNIVANICPKEYYVFNIEFSNVIFVIFFGIYCSFNLILLSENVNFVINIYRMFNVYHIYRALDVSENDD